MHCEGFLLCTHVSVHAADLPDTELPEADTKLGCKCACSGPTAGLYACPSCPRLVVQTFKFVAMVGGVDQYDWNRREASDSETVRERIDTVRCRGHVRNASGCVSTSLTRTPTQPASFLPLSLTNPHRTLRRTLDCRLGSNALVFHRHLFF
jgi:hypothetical protein